MKYYTLKATFTYSHYRLCLDCRYGDYGVNSYYDKPELDSIYNDDDTFKVTKTVYQPIDNIKEFMSEYDEHINPDMTFKNSFPKINELEKIAIGNYIDEEIDCDNKKCKNGEYVFAGKGRAKVNDYDSNCIKIELVEDKKRQFEETLNNDSL